MEDAEGLIGDALLIDGYSFNYSKNFLKWALQPPGYKEEWHIGVRVSTNKKLVGFITAIPATIRVRDKSAPMVEINFLCVHKKLRAKRLAPVLIKVPARPPSPQTAHPNLLTLPFS